MLFLVRLLGQILRDDQAIGSIMTPEEILHHITEARAWLPITSNSAKSFNGGSPPGQPKLECSRAGMILAGAPIALRPKSIELE